MNKMHLFQLPETDMLNHFDCLDFILSPVYHLYLWNIILYVLAFLFPFLFPFLFFFFLFLFLSPHLFFLFPFFSFLLPSSLSLSPSFFLLLYHLLIRISGQGLLYILIKMNGWLQPLLYLGHNLKDKYMRKMILKHQKKPQLELVFCQMGNKVTQLV